MTKETVGKKSGVLMAYVKMLRQHFDTVRIFCTVHDAEEEVTYSFDEGSGNLKAQEGQVQEWLVQKRAMVERDGWDHAYENRGGAGEGEEKS